MAESSVESKEQEQSKSAMPESSFRDEGKNKGIQALIHSVCPIPVRAGLIYAI